MTSETLKTVTSRKNIRVVIDGHRFSTKIYRLEHEPLWTLEVVDDEGVRHVWAKRFDTEREARDEAIRALDSSGPAAFKRGNNIVPFPNTD